MAGKRITTRTVNALKPGAIAWDGELKGFGVRRQRDAKTYLVKYRLCGRQRWYTIGRHGSPWTLEKARIKAKSLLGMVADGKDPAAILAEERAAGTVAQLCDRYLAEGCATKKPSTLATDCGRIERHIKPLLGRVRVKDVTQNDVARFMKDVAAGKTAADVRTGPRGRARVTGGKGTAARTVGLLGGIFAFAVAEGARVDNPVRGVKRYRDRKADRYLSPDELARLGEALSKAEAAGENPIALAGIRLLVLTGCRKSEILTLQWAHVDFERALLRLPDTKTGEAIIPLGAPALEVLAFLPRLEGNPYVLPGDKSGRHMIGLPKVWERVRKRAGLDGVRLHDLRHSFASVGAGAGMGLPIVGKLLGHRDPKTTARYAHIADDPAKAAADRIAGHIAAAMRGEPNKAQVVKLSKRKA